MCEAAEISATAYAAKVHPEEMPLTELLPTSRLQVAQSEFVVLLGETEGGA